jgi:hypothetical protein
MYNADDPKEELHAYMFDEYGKKSMDNAFNGMKKLNIKVFTFNVTNEKVDIINYEDQNIVFTYTI